jgi:NADPH:quinone reductase-like Zn-dependent oxidoreductase
VEHDLHPPSEREIRVKVLAASVSFPDVEARYGWTPFPPKTPYVPGYAVVGAVDALGGEVDQIALGDIVAVMTTYGGYSEYVFAKRKQLIPVPEDLDSAEVVPLILNYIVAYQSLHRSAKVCPGEKVLIIGASGGIGTAFLQLGRLTGLTMYGIASKDKHHILREYGAAPIDYHTEDFVEVIQGMEPEGLDAVFDGVAGEYIERGFSLLRRGGRFVCYANPGSIPRMIRLVGRVFFYNLFPNGRSATFYGTGSVHLNRRPFLEDWAALFELLKGGQIKPVIARKFPLLEAARANEMLESGTVIGNIVLVAPELY